MRPAPAPTSDSRLIRDLELSDPAQKATLRSIGKRWLSAAAKLVAIEEFKLQQLYAGLFVLTVTTPHGRELVATENDPNFSDIVSQVEQEATNGRVYELFNVPSLDD